MFDLGLILFYLGIAVTQDCADRILRLGQELYSKKILKNHKM